MAALPLAAWALSRDANAAPGFGEADVSARARELSRLPYKQPPAELPPALANVDYDGYRDVHFDPDRALWKSDGLPFQLQFFHRGGLHRDRVDIYEVRDGRPVAVRYSPDQFRSNSGTPTGLSPNLGFAGFRIHAPINRRSYFDEVAVFLGASYFRAVAKDMVYGLSARGLALGVAEDEEFPAFRAFWITRPEKSARNLEVLALMDGPSCTGAFRFVVTPGETTIFDTTAHLFPRRSRGGVGIAPLTSMFLFGPEGGRRFNEVRPQIHDSDGLALVSDRGERLWRPLVNPAAVQSSVLTSGRPPRGFGLVQRERRAEAYGDPLAHYERRPSLWVEPVGDWGAGELRLVELPAHTEYQDNVVALWAPAAGLKAGVEARFAYRLHWGSEVPAEPVARVSRTHCDTDTAQGRARLLVEFELPEGLRPKALTANVSSDAGAVSDVLVEAHPDRRRAVRLTFQIDPNKSRTANLRAVLLQAGKPCSEVWVYRWTA